MDAGEGACTVCTVHACTQWVCENVMLCWKVKTQEDRKRSFRDERERNRWLIGKRFLVKGSNGKPSGLLPFAVVRCASDEWKRIDSGACMLLRLSPGIQF